MDAACNIEKIGSTWALCNADGGVFCTFSRKRNAEQCLEVVQGLVAMMRAIATKKISHTEWELWYLFDETDRCRVYLERALVKLAEEAQRDAARVAEGYGTWNSCRGYADRGGDLIRLDAEYTYAARALHKEINRELKRNPDGDTAIGIGIAVFFCAGVTR